MLFLITLLDVTVGRNFVWIYLVWLSVFFFTMPGGDDGEEEKIAVNHMSVKAPPFYLKSPSTWFKQLESQFVLANITKSETKYHHVMAALPENIACDVITDSNTYPELKEAILNSLKGNKHELITQALSTMSLGDKRPSQLVTEIKRRFEEIGLAVDDAIVKSRLLSALPPNLRSALVGHDTCTLDEYAKIADSMLAVASAESPFININSVANNSNPRNPFTHGTPDRSYSSQNFPENSQNYPDRAHNSQNFPERPRRFFNTRQGQEDRNHDSRFSARPFYADQRPKICNAHIFYANRARTCRRWCQWPGNRPRSLEDNQATPRQSRPNSPIKG